MNERKRIIWVSFALGFIVSCITAYLLEGLIIEFFDNMSQGNVDFRDAPDPSDIALREELSRLKGGELLVVDLATTTIFAWDRLYLIGGYAQPSEIDDLVGRSWRDNCYTGISASEGVLLVFTANGVVIHCIDSKEDFLIPQQAYREGISSQEALFKINEHGRIVWVLDTDSP